MTRRRARFGTPDLAPHLCSETALSRARLAILSRSPGRVDPRQRMNLVLDYSDIWPRVPYLLAGAWLSLQIAFLAFCGGMVIGLFGAMAKTYGGRSLQRAVDAYVSFFTNTPQLVQIYFIFFALPD